MPNHANRELLDPTTVQQATRVLATYIAAIRRGVQQAQGHPPGVHDIREVPVELPATIVDGIQIPLRFMAKSCVGQEWLPPGTEVELLVRTGLEFMPHAVIAVHVAEPSTTSIAVGIMCAKLITYVMPIWPLYFVCFP